MILKAEITIDIDDRRKVWITLAAKPEEGDDPLETLEALSTQIVEQGCAAFDHAAARFPGVDAAPGPDLRTFGEDD